MARPHDGCKMDDRTISSSCPHCGASNSTKRTAIGRWVKCCACGASIFMENALDGKAAATNDTLRRNSSDTSTRLMFSGLALALGCLLLYLADWEGLSGDLLIPAGAVLCLVGLSLPFTWHLFDALWDETERKG